MNFSGSIVDELRSLIELFAHRCADRSTLDELATVLATRADWRKAHALFTRIRKKSLAVEDSQQSDLCLQYAFEEMCAKTIYNLSGESAPFDPDSPYFVVPTALRLARSLEIDESLVLDVVR